MVGLKQYFGRHELAAVIIVSLLFFLLAISGTLSSMKLFGTAYNSVDVTYSQGSDVVLIKETYHARIGLFNSFNVLYRSFEEPLCLVSQDEQCTIMIVDVQCEKGFAYVSKNGEPLQPENGDTIDTFYVSSKIQAREIGCYDNEAFHQEESTFSVTYAVPLTHVQKNQYEHILFSQDHFAINKLTTQGPEGKDSAAHLPKDGTIHINTRTGDITAKQSHFIITLIFAIIFGSIPYLVWKKWGTEKNFTVPEYLHTIPDKKMAPWQVDVLTNGTFELSKNGMASILMELYSAKVVSVQKVKKFLANNYEFFIDTRKEQSPMSDKARSFLDYLKKNSVRTEGKTIVAQLPQISRTNQSFMKAFFKEGDVGDYIKRTYDKKGYNFIIGLQIIGMLFLFLGKDLIGLLFSALFSASNITTPLIIFGFLLFFFIIFAVPASVFSRFKDDNYKTYLEWQAFGKMLKDYAQMKKYLKEDAAIWKEWLVYATALGSAENLLKSLKELNIMSPTEYEETRMMHTNIMTMAMLNQAAASPKSSGGGGGIGGGGGFGGGGGGGR